MQIDDYKKNTEFLSDILIHIVGPNNLQNELLARHLEQETSLLCSWCNQLHFLPIPQEDDHGISQLILWDCQNYGKEEIYKEFQPGGKLNLPQCFIALFNLHPDLVIETETINLGVRGIFSKDAPLNLLSKCVVAILSGELWYSRDVLEKYALQPQNTTAYHNAGTNLTAREKEILRCIAAGDSNKRIADRFAISPHTVKTHTYNIFKKIKVSNRLHATLWATRNLF
ncbi:MAG: response regulator transcription factor [Desulfobulbaceae bacterium]|nr:response regulator transcription factor [Desulfobulbaceae bacterium]